MSRFVFAAALGVGVASLGLAGCGESVGSYCYEAKNCEGGNDFDEEACNIYYQEVADLADLQNCSSEYDLWFECVAEQSRCNDDRYVLDEDACRNEEDQLKSCADFNGEF